MYTEDPAQLSDDTPAEQVLSPSPEPDTTRDSRRGIIAVVDDDPDELAETCRHLRSAGYSVVEALDGRVAAQEIARREHCDLVITEIQMAGGDGFRLMQVLKGNQRFRMMPVIIYSSNTQPELVRKALEFGAADFIAKPADPASLLSKVDRALEKANRYVLIIDDTVIVRDLLHKVVKREGYRVLVARSAEEGLEIIQSHNIAAVISDITLPKMSGFDFLVAVKESHPRLPVILITGHTGEFTRDDAISAGADGYICKPFKNTEIAARLSSLIR